MADHGLIAAYLRELRYSVARLADADDLVFEAEDHLLEVTDHLVGEGHSRAEAEAEALGRFGSASLISRVCASEAKRGAAVPTRRTRSAGLALLLSPVLVVAGQWLNVHVPSSRGPVHGIGLAMLVAAFPAFLVGLWGLRARHGGLGRFGAVALVLALVSPILSLAAGWGALIAFAFLLSLAVIVFAVEMLRASVLPVIPVVLLAAGPICSFALIASITWIVGGDAGDVMVYPLLLSVVGFVWLGVYLWREPTFDPSPGPLSTA